jgi:hypothetical protein
MMTEMTACKLTDNRMGIGNFPWRLAPPKSINDWSLRTIRKKLVNIGARAVSHARYVTLQMAELAGVKIAVL